MSDCWFIPKLTPSARRRALEDYLNWTEEDIIESEGGLKVPSGMVDALKSLILHAEKKNWGRAHDYKPKQTKIIPSSLCGSIFLRKVSSGNIRQAISYS